MNKIILSGCLIVNDKNEIPLLYKDKHKHYETPGGKVEANECLDLENPTVEELSKTAERELKEELGNDFKFKKLEYFGSYEFKIPDGKEAIAHKFITSVISGTPRINEPETFSKLDYLPIKNLENYPIFPDLKLFLNKLKDHFK